MLFGQSTKPSFYKTCVLSKKVRNLVAGGFYRFQQLIHFSYTKSGKVFVLLSF